VELDTHGREGFVPTEDFKWRKKKVIRWEGSGRKGERGGQILPDERRIS